MNAMEWNRDLRKPVFHIRKTEKGMTDKLDLQKLPQLLTERGYTKEDITNILSRNWIRFMENAWG